MKLLNAAFSAFLIAESCTAFTSPSARTGSFGVISQRVPSNGKVSAVILNDGNTPFFANDEKPEPETEEPEVTAQEDMDTEIARLVEVELSKTRRMSNLRNEKGVDYAPWMQMTEEDENKIREIVTKKTIARRMRQEQEKKVSGNLYLDSQAQELSGTGLNCKVIDKSVELEWATGSETDTVGFIIKRRKARTDDFSVIADYKSWGPLVSQGIDGGFYRYMDEEIGPGGFVYRITEVDSAGVENDICQSLVEIQTDDEKKAGLIAGVGIAAIAVIALTAGILADPMNGGAQF